MPTGGSCAIHALNPDLKVTEVLTEFSQALISTKANGNNKVLVAEIKWCQLNLSLLPCFLHSALLHKLNLTSLEAVRSTSTCNAECLASMPPALRVHEQHCGQLISLAAP